MANLQNPLNTLLYSVPQNAPDFDDSPRKAKYLIYFLPGNPGLVEYYRIFLKTLHEQLVHSLGGSDQRVDVLGITLAGFECGEADTEDVRKIIFITMSLSTLMLLEINANCRSNRYERRSENCLSASTAS